MSAPAPAPRPGIVRRVVAAVLLLALFAWTLIVHHGMGPRPDLGLAWYSPRGFLTRALLSSPFESLLVDRTRGIAVFLLPALLLASGVWITTRSALARAAALGAVFSTWIFLFFALGSSASQLAWNLFHWRASATMLATGAALGALVAAPWLAARWLRLGWPARLLCYLPVAFAVVAVVRNVTGTNPRLPFALSPWPAFQVFGLEVAGTVVAALLAGVAIGLVGLVRLRRPGTGRALGVLALLAGLAVPALWLWAGSGGLLPFRAGPRAWGVASALVALVLVLAAALPGGPRPRLGRRARAAGVAALLIGLPLVIGELWARLDYRHTRTVTAARLIDALAEHYAEQGVYPDSLSALVSEGRLESVPRPAIGFSFLADGESFTYQGFGTSYLLEFPAPRWVQCAYNPPYEDEEGEEGDPEAIAEDEGGAWSCPSTPPELW